MYTLFEQLDSQCIQKIVNFAMKFKDRRRIQRHSCQHSS